MEANNKILVYNTMITYIRLIITAICGILTTRFALQALGVNDFGLFSVLGSIISFIGIINTIMLTSSNRFITVAIGKGDKKEVNQAFNINFAIHAVIALLTLVIAIPLGDWYIHRYIQCEVNLDVATQVFNITIIGSVISFIGVPYNGLLSAKENFTVFCFADSIAHIIKTLLTYALIFVFNDKLFAYAFIVALTTATPTIIYVLYCSKKYREIVNIRIVKDIKKYKEILAFSGWVAYGAIACVGKAQGAALIINMFFSTVANTALGLANTVNSMISSFANSATKSISPQITKNYAVGNMERCDQLLVWSSKLTFFLTLLVSLPFLIETEFVLALWLGQVPQYAVLFTRLLIIDGLIASLNAGISEMIFASGKIKLYQIAVNSMLIISIIVAYFVLKMGTPPEYLLYIYIVFSIFVLIVRQIVLRLTLKYDLKKLYKYSYLPSTIVMLFVLPLFFLHPTPYPIINIVLCILYLLVIIYMAGLNKQERKMAISLVCKRS